MAAALHTSLTEPLPTASIRSQRGSASRTALSTAASSPTSLRLNDLNLIAYADGMVIEKLSGGSYVDTGIKPSLHKYFCLQDVEVVQVSVARARKLGGHHLMQAHNPVFLVTANGPGGARP